MSAAVRYTTAATAMEFTATAGLDATIATVEAIPANITARGESTARWSREMSTAE